MVRTDRQVCRAASAIEGRQDAWQPRIDESVRVAIHQDQTCQDCRHFSGESGRTGRVVKVQAPLSAPSHRYLVVLDRLQADHPALNRTISVVARHYAAHELEPIA